MAQTLKIRWFRCEECGAENQTSEERCKVCGVARPDSPGRFEIPLVFSTGECPKCGEASLPGQCTACGAFVDPVDPNASTLARGRALNPLRERARLLVASFDELPEPHISVTASQLASVVVDANLPGRASELIAFAHCVRDLDLEEPSAIGGATRRAVINVLEEVERVRSEARLLAQFAADEKVADLPTLIGQLGRQGAVVVELVIATLCAQSFEQGAGTCAQLQKALEAPAQAEQIERLLAEVPLLDLRDDNNARISLVLGREGDFTDELGLPDPVRIFAPPPGETTSFPSLALGATHYLAHLLDQRPVELDEGHAMLALSAVQLALLDRPFEHHRRAELVRELLRDAAQNPEALAKALGAYDDHAGLTFETSMRIRRQIRLLATSSVESPIEIVESVVEAYRRVAESHFRAAMRCVLAARAAATGRDAPSEPLLLGTIDDILGGWEGELGSSLRGVVNRHVRNAEAHEEYSVDAETYDVVLADGTRITPDKLAKLTEDLVGVVAAVDAAIACCTIDTGREVGPSWLAEGNHPRLVELILRTIVSGWAISFETLAFQDGVAKIRVEVDARLAPRKAQTLIFAARPLMPQAVSFEVWEADDLLAAFGSDVIDAWSAAAEVDKPVALIGARFDCAVRCGAEQEAALRDAIAVCIRVAINESASGLSSPPSPKQIKRLERRLISITRFAAQHRAGSIASLGAPLGDLRAARDALPKVAQSKDQGRRFVDSIEKLSSWADRFLNDWFE